MPRKPVDTRVLLIEDNVGIIEIYTAKFEADGYDFKVVDDGEAGYNEASKFMPDIILLDVILPKMDGFTILGKLKKSKKTKNIPIIMLTSLSQEGDVQKGLDMGAVSYLSKQDNTPAQVIEEINSVLDSLEKKKTKKTIKKKVKKKKKINYSNSPSPSLSISSG